MELEEGEEQARCPQVALGRAGPEPAPLEARSYALLPGLRQALRGGESKVTLPRPPRPAPQASRPRGWEGPQMPYPTPTLSTGVAQAKGRPQGLAEGRW